MGSELGARRPRGKVGRMREPGGQGENGRRSLRRLGRGEAGRCGGLRRAMQAQARKQRLGHRITRIASQPIMVFTQGLECRVISEVSPSSTEQGMGSVGQEGECWVSAG